MEKNQGPIVWQKRDNQELEKESMRVASRGEGRDRLLAIGCF